MGDMTGWIVCMASIANIFIRSGVVFSFGAFIAEFKQLYHSPMAELGEVFIYFILFNDNQIIILEGIYSIF